MTFSAEVSSILILILFSIVAIFIANPYLRIIFGSISDYFYKKNLNIRFKKFMRK